MRGIVEIAREFLFGPKIEESYECESCETLREQLTFANYDRKVLMETLIKQAFPEKEAEKPIDLDSLRPMSTGKMPWRVRQQQLQDESRQKLAQLKHNAEVAADTLHSESGGVKFNPANSQTIEQLEKEMSLTVPANPK